MAQTPKFRPYRGKDLDIHKIPYSDGYVYFATDTGRIYLDYNGERLSMGGNGASLFYANDTDVKQDLRDYYHIDKSALLDENASIKINDLIINSDGAFYRVIETETGMDTYQCVQIAISGTGGGGGGGSGGGGGTTSSTTLVNLDTVPYTFIYGQSYEVRFKATAENDTKIRILMQIDSSLGSNTVSKTVNSGEEFVLDIGINLFPSNDNRIVITAETDNSGSAEPKRYTGREAIQLLLKKSEDFNPRKIVSDEDLVFYCVPVGAISKTLQISVDGTVVLEKEIPASVSDSTYTVNIPKQSHGVHNVSVVLIANADGTTVTTDPIEYQIAWAEQGKTSPLIWTPNGYPEKIIQYDDLIIEFMVWEPGKTTEIETHFYKNGVELSNSPRNLNYDVTTTQRWNIVDYEVGTNNYTIRVGSTSKPITVEVEEDTERDLSIRTGGLILNLDSAGRSNEENMSSKTSWVSEGTSVPTAVSFKDFNWYNNGWVIDEEGRSCLRISNGASISIPITKLQVLSTDTVESSLAFEFRFKVRNVQEYSTLVTTTSYEDEKGNIIITKEVSTDKGVFGSLYKNLGFCLGTQEAFLKSSNTTVSARYREDEIINLTFVIDNNSASLPLLYIYLQGVLSGIAKYDKSSDRFNAGTNFIEFNSTYCDIDLYNVRIYKGAKLESADVVHNYIADKKDVKAYDANQITTTVNTVPTIDYKKMIQYNVNHPDETIMPYVILDAHGELLPFVKGGKKAVDVEFHNPALDYAYEKGLITDEQYLYGAPSFTYTSGKKSLDVQGTSSQGYPRRNYKWKAKQEDAKWRYLAGPLKDKPIYEYNAEKDKYEGFELNGKTFKKFFLDSVIGETTFCWKADYMESSSTHNTGFASYVSTLYSKHPLQDYFPGLTLPSSIRTTVYGFPMLVFNKTGADTYEFVGRYNFNLDKGATDSCGFTYDIDSYVQDENGKYFPMEEVAECWEIRNNQGQRTSFTKVDFEETTDSYTEIELTSETFKPDTYYIVSHISTSGVKTYTLASTYNANDIYYTKASGVLSVLEDFEYRYSFYEDEIDHAIEGTDEFAGSSQAVRNEAILYRMRNFRDMAIWLESTDVQDSKKLGSLLGDYTIVNITEEEFELGTHYVWNTTNRKWEIATIYEPNAKYATVVAKPVEYEGIVYEYDTKDYRLKKFASEFSQHFDLEYCIIYFIMTELLHLYDSRGKNCMMASWGPKVLGGFYIWYPIFYDIDTQLGINNSGVPSWEYDVNPTDESFFSTSNSVLWNNLWSVFSTAILNRYVEIRKDNLNIDAMDGYYNSHPILGKGYIDSWKEILEDTENSQQLRSAIVSYAKIGKRPAMIYNVDQYYKYISPAISGYINTSGQTATTESFFYCLQGTRELMRYLYLRNRLNFVDSKWHGGSYAKEAALGELKARYNANYISETSDKYLYTDDPAKHNTTEKIYDETGKYLGEFTLWNWDTYGPHPLDCTTEFSGVRSYLKQYMSMQLDSGILDPTYCDGIEPITLKITEDMKNSIKSVGGFSEQLFYLGGGEYIADLGDLGLKYLNEFAIPTLKRLKRLQLGSDVPGYSNARLNSNNLSLGANAYTGDGSINVNAKTLLEEVILTGLGSLSGQIDLTGSEKLKIFRALNTIIAGVSLAQGAQIETLHLPNTITGLQLIEPVALTGILNTPGDIESGFNKGLYIEGITDATNYDKDISIITYDIVGGSLGFDSYRLLKTLINFKLAMLDREKNANLAINLKEVDWTPYKVVEYGESYNAEKADLYYRDNSRFGLSKYTYEEATWEPGTKNGKIYLYDDSIISPITDLSIFDTFIEKYQDAVNYYNNNDGSMEKNYFKNTTPNQTYPTLPEITGTIYIDNEVAIDEAEIANKYLKYFPKVKFFFKNVNKAYMAMYVDVLNGVEEIIYTERKSTSSDDLHLTFPSLEEYTPVRLNNIFIGWCLNADGEGIIYHPDNLDNFEIEWNKLVYSSTENYIKFYAIYDVKKYEIRFYNYNAITGEKELVAYDYVPAGDALTNPNVLPSIDESGLSDTERYGLLGWVTDPKYCYPENKAEGLKHIVNLSNIISENTDREFYACYIVESVYDSATDINLFSFAKVSFSDSHGNGEYAISEGYQIQPSNNNPVYSGKITIPGEYLGLPVIGITNFINQDKLTHIYFEKPENIRYFGELHDNKALVYIEYPANLREIRTDCLKNNSKLRHPTGLANTKLTYVGSTAFVQAFDASLGQIENFQLPGSLKTIEAYAFANIHGSGAYPPAGQYRILNVIFGSADNPSILDFNTIIDNFMIFEQKSLPNDESVWPKDEGANANTPIYSFTFYRAPGSQTPSLTDFEDFVNSTKVMGSNKTCLKIEVIDANEA